MLPWPRNGAAPGALSIAQEGSGRPWATIESLAAVPLRAPFAAGYRIAKTITPVSPAVKGALTRGDVLRVHLEIDAQSDMTWVVVNDPVPSGATILGSGLGRDSEAATHGEAAPGGGSTMPPNAGHGCAASRAASAQASASSSTSST